MFSAHYGRALRPRSNGRPAEPAGGRPASLRDERPLAVADLHQHLPALLSAAVVTRGGKPAGPAEPDPANSVRLHSCQTLTPETETSTHHFFQQSHRADADAGDAAVTEGIYQGIQRAFHEDRDMIAAQHRMLELDPGAKMLPLAMDAALVRYRRTLGEAIAAERSAAATAA
jgi:hypothetical protein